MHVTLSISVLFAVVAVAMVAVCEHSEVCRLRYRLWAVERRHNALERQLRELDAELAERDTPGALIDGAPRRTETPAVAAPRRGHTAPRRMPVAVPASFGTGRDLRWYEGGER